MIVIDGAEGGGQILRTSLTLSLLTGKGVHLKCIRGARSKPGLQRQHLTCVQAALAVGGGAADGDELGSQELVFRPEAIRGGDYHFKISTAGSTTLVLQTVLLALAQADTGSEIRIEGGTHNPMAPPVPFLEKIYLPLLRQMGLDVDIQLERHGFAPAGGGSVRVRVEPSQLKPIEVLDRGAEKFFAASVLAAHLDPGIARREQAVLAKELDWDPERVELETISESRGPGNVILVHGQWDHASELVTAFGAPGRSAESVARQAAKAFIRYRNATAPVGRHLADQLLLPLALAGSGRFRTLPLSGHFETNRKVIEAFLPVKIETAVESRSSVMVSVS